MTTSTRIPRNGYTIAQLAKKTGKSTRTVERWTSESRADFLSRAAARHEKVRRLRSEGLSLRAIADELSISVRAVHYAIHKDAGTS